jgi:indolepyruvate decarboxylase
MTFPSDLANMPVTGEAGHAAEPATDAAASEAAVKAIVDAVSAILPGIIVSRCGLREEAAAVVGALMFFASTISTSQ